MAGVKSCRICFMNSFAGNGKGWSNVIRFH
jgi:hypothetical protein